MNFIIQGLFAMAIMMLLALWIASTPTTDSSRLYPAEAAPADLIFNLRAGQ